MFDSDVRKDVLEELQFEPGLEATHVGVAVHNGVVTLTGHVPSYLQKRTAEEVVSRLKGVKAIAQDIEVRLPSDKKLGDDEIAERALQILDWDDSVPASQIKFKVERGWLTLSGEVNWQFQKQAADAAVHRLSGVAGVTNLITVKPDIDGSEVREKLQRALQRQAALEARSLDIAVDGDKVTLSGHVGSWHERDVANRTAWSIPGVKRVDDRLTVS
jgi:osmotically-inducible protein OsmY